MKQTPQNIRLRPVEEKDRPAVQQLVTQVLVEYGLPPDHSGTDADLAALPQSYAGGYFVVLEDTETNKIVGNGGLFPLREGVAEVRKMYLLPEARGKGLGRYLLHLLINKARELGFKKLELETASVLKEAIGLYQAEGFTKKAAQPEVKRCDAVFELEL